jgi:type II secretory pathway pseudopilin PulG
MQAGSTLTEILVALLIFSLTTVTATTMLLDSLRSLNNAINQQHAARLASNLQAIITDLPRDLLNIPATLSPANQGNCDVAARCTPADWLATEFRRLQEQADKDLPAGRVELIEEPSGIAIRVSWASSSNSHSHRNRRLTYALQYDTV